MLDLVAVSSLAFNLPPLVVHSLVLFFDKFCCHKYILPGHDLEKPAKVRWGASVFGGPTRMLPHMLSLSSGSGSQTVLAHACHITRSGCHYEISFMNWTQTNLSTGRNTLRRKDRSPRTVHRQLTESSRPMHSPQTAHGQPTDNSQTAHRELTAHAQPTDSPRTACR